MKSTAFTVLSALCVAVTLALSGTGQDEPAPRLRIGIYDSRSIAIAFAASAHNPAREKMDEMQKAKAAGDEKTAGELERWGRDFQVQLHFQGFGSVNVSDLLLPVKDGLADIAARHQLVAIADGCDFTAANTETVDVTEDLVKLFNPSDRTMKQALEVRSQQPVPLHTIARMKPGD